MRSVTAATSAFPGGTCSSTRTNEIRYVCFSYALSGGKHRETTLRSAIRDWKVGDRPRLRLETGRFLFRQRQTESGLGGGSYWKASGTWKVNIALWVLSDAITF